MTDRPDRSPLLTRRAMIAGGILGASAVLANAQRPDKPLRMIRDANIDPLFPMKIGSWEYRTSSGLVLPPEDDAGDRFYNAILTRYYVSPADLPIMLLVAYNGTQDGMLQVHRPEACYPAAGYELLEQRTVPLAPGGGLTVPGRFISARSTSRREQLIYWTRIGNAFPTAWWHQHLAVALENIRGRVPDGVLVRISTSAPDDTTAMRTLNRFLSAMAAGFTPMARRLVFGEAGAPQAGT